MTSRPLYVYLQRPDTGEWVTVGRYLLNPVSGIGRFRYAGSYMEAGLTWAIDPVNLPFLPAHDFLAPRYGGLHDVLRDAAPDAWGKLLLQREHGLAPTAHESQYLAMASNIDRWGALAVGPGKKPSIARLASPRLPQLETLVQELLAIAERRPPVDARLRTRLVATASLGGARPKTTVHNDDEFWLVKPILRTDPADIPLLEHFAQQWGAAAGLRFAETVHHRLADGLSALRVLRFDRCADRRIMAISAASLLQTEYPPSHAAETARWSYPRLAEELRRIGAPTEDRIELFGRMVFNAVIGNDDDHPRNHAAIFDAEERRWRLSPAFDVVPNAVETPRFLSMQIGARRMDISREALLADAVRFGFDSRDDAARYLDALLLRIRSSFTEVAMILTQDLHDMMRERLARHIGILSRSP